MILLVSNSSAKSNILSKLLISFLVKSESILSLKKPGESEQILMLFFLTDLFMYSTSD